MALQFYPLEVKEIIKETARTVSIRLDLPEDLKEIFKYESGQYLTVKRIINGEEIRRSYSISSAKGIDNHLQISSKMLDGGKMSTYLYKELGVGDELEVMPPQGNFVLKDKTGPLVLFAAGSGITPIFSILKEALHNGEQVVHLYYGNRSEEETIFKEQLDELRKDHPERFLAQHFLSSNGERLDTELVPSLLTGLGDEIFSAHYYVCGPTGMIEAVKLGLEQAKIASTNIHIEFFSSPKETQAPVDSVSSDSIHKMKVVLDGEEHQLNLENGEFILDAASRIGIDPPYSCQSGVCTTCKAKLVQGEVEMENNFGLGDDEIQDGYVLTCIGKPKTSGVIIDWDEV